MNRTLLVIAATMSLVGTAPTAFCEDLPIQNSSFEEPVVLAPEAAAVVGSLTVDLSRSKFEGVFSVSFPSDYSVYQHAGITGWEVFDPEQVLTGEIKTIPRTDFEDFSDMGIQNSTEANFDPVEKSKKNVVPDGQNSLFVFAVEEPGSAAIGYGVRQVIDAAIEQNTRYTLAVDVGDPKVDPTFPLDGFPGYRIDIWAGNHLLATDKNSQSIPLGSFKTIELSFTVFEKHPNLGDDLEIRLINPIVDYGVEVHFDKVRMRAEMAPVGEDIVGSDKRDDDLSVRTGDTGYRVFGRKGDDTLDASAGNGSNALFGEKGNDKLIGGSSDRLSGDEGNDSFYFTGGNNLAEGGPGDDLFWIASGKLPEVANIISDFDKGKDRLGISASSDIGFGDLKWRQSGDDAVVSTAAGQTLAILLNVRAKKLDAGDFIFK